MYLKIALLRGDTEQSTIFFCSWEQVHLYVSPAERLTFSVYRSLWASVFLCLLCELRVHVGIIYNTRIYILRNQLSFYLSLLFLSINDVNISRNDARVDVTVKDTARPQCQPISAELHSCFTRGSAHGRQICHEYKSQMSVAYYRR